MTEENKDKRPTKEEILRSIWGEPVFESNNPKGIIDARNRPPKTNNVNTEESK